MQKLGFKKIQEATRSLSDLIYTPINDNRNTTELMFFKKINLVYLVLHRSIGFLSQRDLERRGIRQAVGRTGRHGSDCCAPARPGKEGRVG